MLDWQLHLSAQLTILILFYTLLSASCITHNKSVNSRALSLFFKTFEAAAHALSPGYHPKARKAKYSRSYRYSTCTKLLKIKKDQTVIK
jgi:hypothetical protein